VKCKTGEIWGATKNYLFLILNVAMLIFLFEYIGFKRGLLVFVGFYAVFALIIIIRKWENFLSIMKWLETQLFGRPLDKEFWPEGFENRPKRKIRIVWKKKNKGGQNEERQR